MPERILTITANMYIILYVLKTCNRLGNMILNRIGLIFSAQAKP